VCVCVCVVSFSCVLCAMHAPLGWSCVCVGGGDFGAGTFCYRCAVGYTQSVASRAMDGGGHDHSQSKGRPLSFFSQ